MTNTSGSASIATGDRRGGHVGFWVGGVLLVGVLAAVAAIAVGATSHQEGDYVTLGAALVGLLAGAAVAVLG